MNVSVSQMMTENLHPSTGLDKTFCFSNGVHQIVDSVISNHTVYQGEKSFMIYSFFEIDDNTTCISYTLIIKEKGPSALLLSNATAFTAILAHQNNFYKHFSN